MSRDAKIILAAWGLPGVVFLVGLTISAARWHAEADAYSRGRVDASKGKPASANPYEASRLAGHWLSGYNQEKR